MATFSYLSHGCYGRKPIASRINRQSVTFAAPGKLTSLVSRYGKLAIALYVAQDLAIGVALGMAQYLGYAPQFPFLN